MDGVQDSGFQSADEFHKLVVVMSGGDVNVLVTSWEAVSVEVTEVWVVWGGDVLVVVVEFSDGVKTLGEPLEVVTGKELLVDVVVVRSVSVGVAWSGLFVFSVLALNFSKT